jgi:hypothetical protein
MLRLYEYPTYSRSLLRLYEYPTYSRSLLRLYECCGSTNAAALRMLRLCECCGSTNAAALRISYVQPQPAASLKCAA